MKRQTQVPGVRRWYGDDFLELQSETLTAIDAIVGAYNKPCVVTGCEVSGGKIAKGFVALSVPNEGLKMMPFDGATIATPCYLTAVKTPVNSVYADGIARLSAYQYKAVASTETPDAGVSFLKVEANGKSDRLTDVMQDATHRMVTDAEKGVWDSKETPAGAQAKANKARGEAVSLANTYTNNSETQIRGFVGTVETGLHRITESLTTTKADKTETIMIHPNTSTTPVPGHNAPLDDVSRIVYCTSQFGNDRGVYALFSTGTTNAFAIQSSAGENSDFYITKKCISSFPAAGHTPYYWSGAKLLHTENTLQVVSAGKISDDGGYADTYKGTDVASKKMTTGKYRVSHFFGDTNYTVTITPLSAAAKSFAITAKSANYFEVQFNSTTDFEFQVLEY